MDAQRTKGRNVEKSGEQYTNKMEISIGDRKPKKNPKGNSGVEKYNIGNEQALEELKARVRRKN